MTVNDLVKTADPLTASATLRGLNTVRQALAPDLNDDELRLFAMVSTRSGLDPFARQVFAIKRKGRVTFQTSIDGYRSIASRTGLYDGQDGTLFGPDHDCTLRLGGEPFVHPSWAEVWVYRKGVNRPYIGHADWHETAPADPREGAGMWATKPRLMLAKCAEAQGLRRAFPWDGNSGQGIPTGLYTPDEVHDDEAPDGEAAEVPTGRAAVAARAAALRAVDAPEASPEPIMGDGAGPITETEYADVRPVEACGQVGPEGDVAAGEVCAGAAGHGGPHVNAEATVSWPNR